MAEPLRTRRLVRCSSDVTGNHTGCSCVVSHLEFLDHHLEGGYAFINRKEGRKCAPAQGPIKERPGSAATYLASVSMSRALLTNPVMSTRQTHTSPSSSTGLEHCCTATLVALNLLICVSHSLLYYSRNLQGCSYFCAR